MYWLWISVLNQFKEVELSMFCGSEFHKTTVFVVVCSGAKCLKLVKVVYLVLLVDCGTR